MKKIFENAIWWSGVVMIGLVLGLTLQFVRAWTEPAQSPPGGNLGAPVNTGPVAQLKNGVLGVLGLMVYNDFNSNGINVTGKVLTAQDAYGAAAWAAGGGGGGCYISFKAGCSGDGCCLSGFANKGSLGGWGGCHRYSGSGGAYYGVYFKPPGGNCDSQSGLIPAGEAFLCCQ